MYRLIEHINRDHGVTVIMVSHDLHAAAHGRQSVFCIWKTGNSFSAQRKNTGLSDIGQRFLGGGEKA